MNVCKTLFRQHEILHQLEQFDIFFTFLDVVVFDLFVFRVLLRFSNEPSREKEREIEREYVELPKSVVIKVQKSTFCI